MTSNNSLAGPSTKSYADVAKIYRPPHALIIDTHRPKYTMTMQAYQKPASAVQADLAEDEWTEVSSMTSCTWPSSPDWSVYSSEGPERFGGSEEWASGWLEETWSHDTSPDTRAAATLASKIKKTIRAQRLHDDLAPVYGCFLERRFPKLWESYPQCHKKYYRRGYCWRMPAVRLKQLKRRMIRFDMEDVAN